MIDIHCHILPAVDDGPANLAESLDMCRMARRDGISHIVATPHANKGCYRNDDPEEISRQVEKLNRLCSSGLSIYPGADYCLTMDLMSGLGRRKFQTINNRQYILLEIPDDVVLPNLPDLFFKFQLAGMVPVITHPERNFAVQQDPSKIYHWVTAGNLIQLTAGSVYGRFGKRVREISLLLIKHHLVHFIATDAHGIRSRRPFLKRARLVVEKEAGQETADLLFSQNPKKAVNGEEIEPDEMGEPEEPGKNQLWWFLKKIGLTGHPGSS